MILKHILNMYFLLYLYIFGPPKMLGSKVFCPGSGKFGPDSKIFRPYCPRAVRFLTNLSWPARILRKNFREAFFVDETYRQTL